MLTEVYNYSKYKDKNDLLKVDPQVALMEDDKLSSAANSDAGIEEDRIVEVKPEEIKPAE